MMPTGRVILGLILLALPASRAAAQPAGRVLVMPFENVTRESRIFWLGEASAVILTDDLTALGVDAMARQERREAFDRLQVPSAASLTNATVIRIGELVGASQVVVGSLQLEGETLVVNARAIALDVGRVQHTATERGPVADLFGIFERVARKIAPPSPRTTEDIEREHPPIAAFENYVKGLLAATPATAITYLNSALRLEPSFARARLALWEVYAEQGRHDRALAAVDRVAPESPSAERARFLAGLSQLNVSKHDDAFATYRALAERRPSAAVLNNMGVAQLRRGGTLESDPPTRYFKQAADADPLEADYRFNLGYAHWLEGDAQAAIESLREAVRRNPADGDAHFVLGAALSATGRSTEATRERELAGRLSSTYEAWETRSGPVDVPGGLERIKRDIERPRAGRIDLALASGEQRDQQELARFYHDRGRRLYEQEQDREALLELNRAVFLAPYNAATHLLVARIHLRGGRASDAIDALKIALWSAETAEARVVLAQAYLESHDVASAHAEAERALVLDPSSVEAKRILDRAGRP
jgi:tetratricopeptide (TPR) repeat protein